MSEMKSAIPILCALALSCAMPIESSAQESHSNYAPASRTTVVGEASWYGPGMQGHRTATGERFDSRKLTAASKQIPLGARAVVTNLDNGRSVRVKINDCGPYLHGRKVDLSRQAARRLHMLHDGTAQVAVKVVSVPPGATKCDGTGS